MRNLDEILADAKGKNVDRFQPHAHDTRTAVEPVAEIPQPKAAPSVKEHKSRKISTRGLLLLLVLGVAGVGTVFGLASTGSLTLDSNSESLKMLSTTFYQNVTVQNTGTSTVTFLKYEITSATQSAATATYFQPQIVVTPSNSITFPIRGMTSINFTLHLTTERGHIFSWDLVYKDPTVTISPNVGKEAINNELTTFNNNTEVVLSLRNVGSASISITSYYVKDANGNQYTMTSFNGQAIAPNALGQTQIDIGTASGATNGGQPFVFTSGYSYTILVVTSRNNQFSFTVTP